MSVVSEGYFATMKMSLVGGRDFSTADVPESTPVAIVNVAFARDHVGAGTIIGRSVRLMGSASASPPTLIVGVVGDSKYESLMETAGPIIYLADRQRAVRDTRIRMVIRTSGDPSVLTGAVRKVVEQTDPQLTLRYTVLSRQLEESVLRERLMAALTSAFGGVGMVLALTGVFGVTAYVVSRRYREFGVRIAMGATRSAIVRMILKELTLVLAVGIVIGGVVAVAAGMSAASLLFGVNPFDAATLATVVAVLASGGVLAALGPAVRASRVDPVQVLRV
jgi:hypothetical protein